MEKNNEIFKKGSKTYFNSSKFFSEEVKKDVSILYAFVRTADDLVDSIPQKKEDFFEFKKNFYLSRKGIKTTKIIDDFITIEKKFRFNKLWAKAFLNAMEKDLTVNSYKDMKSLLKYVYGSAEVVGLFMAKILKLDKKSYSYARLLGRSMQYINFIRDINEDSKIGRIYFPKSDLKKYGLSSLKKEEILKNPKSFEKFISKQLSYYKKWSKQSLDGFKFIPKKDRVAIKTATKMYLWTAKIIEKDPLIVFKKKVKPSKLRIFKTAILVKVLG
jgi:15-cis-phytoene synthase